jgi:hypothetical protein
MDASVKHFSKLAENKDFRKTRYGTTHFQKSYILLPFAMICGSGEPEETSELWGRHKQGMSENFVGRCFAETVPLCALPGMNETLRVYAVFENCICQLMERFHHSM